MSRDFFQRPQPATTGVNGTIIENIQLALNATGATLQPDGLYGGQTAAALSTFQRSRGFPVTGNVSDATWKALTRTDEPPMFERCLQVVASFEGTGFTLVVGNFDGAGVTWGIVGFTLMGGELGTVLTQVNHSRPDLITRAFSHDAEQILHITGPAASTSEKTAWADSISRGAQKYNVAEPWRTYFHDLGSFREVQQIQVARARDVYWTIATGDATKLQLGEELDYLLMYDIAVQNGGMGAKNRLKDARTSIAQHNPATAQAKRAIIADIVAKTASAKYQQDVRERKMSIAAGGGRVHGGDYNLAEWGFLDGQAPVAV